MDTINGYVSECHFYIAKEIVTKEGLGERVVNDLTRKLAGNNYKNYHIYCDIFYKLLTLSILLKDGIYVPVRPHRKGFPESLNIMLLEA